MTTRLAIIICVSVFFGVLLIGAIVTVVREIVQIRKEEKETGEKQGSWWQRHKPTKRRLIGHGGARISRPNGGSFSCMRRSS